MKAGDRVAVEPLIPCGECEACKAGDRVKCKGWGRMYSYGLLDTGIEPVLLGGYAEYMYLYPTTVMHRMSRELPADVAVLFNPLGAGVRWAVTESDLKLGDSILICGAGQRGLCCVIAARAAGAGQILVTELSKSPDKLGFALELGADAGVVADEEDTVERGGQPFERIHTASYPLERAEEAIHHLAGRTGERPATHVAIRARRLSVRGAQPAEHRLGEASRYCSHDLPSPFERYPRTAGRL